MNWETVISFLSENWRVVVDCAALLLSVVICLIRKRPCINEIDTIKKDILDYLPSMINLVEKAGHGSEKKEAVLDLIRQLIKRKYGFALPADLVEFASTQIENILSTPSKKGE